MDNQLSARALSVLSQLTLATLLIACSACGVEPPAFDIPLSRGSDEQPNSGIDNTKRYNSLVSSLDKHHWEATLNGVLDVINDQSLYAVQKYGVLTVPQTAVGDTVEVVTFVQDDGIIGTRSRVTCPGGGHYDVTETTASADEVILNLDNCVFEAAVLIEEEGVFEQFIGEAKIGGVVERFNIVNDAGQAVTSLRLQDYSVVNGSHSVRVLSGRYDFENGHPFSHEIISGMSYEVVKDGQTTTLTNVESTDTSIFGTAFERELSASFIVSAPWTFDQPLRVTTPRELAGMPIGGSANAGGLLMLETEQGDRLSVDMNSGQGEMALITLEHAGAVTTEYRKWEALFGQR